MLASGKTASHNYVSPGVLPWSVPVILWVVTTYFVVSSETSDCIHDLVQPQDVMATRIHYMDQMDQEQTNVQSSRMTKGLQRRKRAAKELYKPIRIHVEYHGLKLLTEEEQTKLKGTVKKITTKISNILSVIPVKDRLLLRRSPNACTSIWADGVNAGKCSNVKTYERETCLDHFQIPEEHLEGLFIWNYTYPKPIKEVVADGPGIPNADYVLYVRAESTSSCFRGGQNIIAYAAYCQVDQNYRPIAGYTNFCPSLLRNNEDDDKIAVTALHEFFHALGFTSALFNNYKDCSDSETGLHCVKRHKPVRLKRNRYRLVTPRVVDATSKHFSCVFNPAHNEFGPMLQTEDGFVRSHWDAAFMFGSLMAPTIGLPELTKLDNITLAAFEDMGWYKVNYAYADNYIWGKDGGCDFATEPSCREDTEYFCKPSEDTSASQTGCHYLHQHKGSCKTDDFLRECSVYQVTTQRSCRDTKNQKHARQDEKYQPDSRCFLANLTSKSEAESFDLSPHCYEHQCVEEKLQVRVGIGPWTDCPYSQHIEVVGYDGVLACPKEGVLCVMLPDIPVPTPAPSLRPAANPSLPLVPTDAVTLCIDVHFPNVNYRWLESMSMLNMFKEEVTSLITRRIGISRQRVAEAAVIYESVVIFRFSLLPAHYPNDGPPTEGAYRRLVTFVNAANFTVTLPPGGTKYTASYITRKQGGPEYSSSELPSGVKAGIVIGSLVAAVVIAGLVLYIQRYYALHSRIRPNHSFLEAEQTLAAQRQAALRDPEVGHWAGHDMSGSTLSTSDIHMETVNHQET